MISIFIIYHIYVSQNSKTIKSYVNRFIMGINNNTTQHQQRRGCIHRNVLFPLKRTYISPYLSE